jgi:hypothetical protein
MTEPKQPNDHPSVEEAPMVRPHVPNGVPPEASEADAKGVPTSDRQATETAAHPDKHQP